VEFRRIIYFRTPLEQGHGGRQQAIRVTEDGCDARCGALLHDLEIGKHTTTSSTFSSGTITAFGLRG
jgi:hypothetical protein